jgi:transcription elongation factor GreA
MKRLITQEGRDNLIKRLNELKQREIECRSELEEAKSASSEVSENVEFELAKEEMAKVSNEVAELTNIIQNTQVVDPSKIQTETVQAYNKVKLLDINTNKELNYMLVSDKEVNIKEGKISYSSPIGSALVGKTINETVSIKIPSGTKDLKIIEIYV